MATQENEIERLIHMVLEQHGFEVSRLSDPSGPAADFRLAKDGESYVVELKSKFDDPSDLAAYREDLRGDGVAVWEETIEAKAPIAAAIKKGVRQLSAVAAPNDLRILWLVAAGSHPDVQVDLLKATVLGMVGVLRADGSGAEEVPCYYFAESAFFRHRNDLDAAIIGKIDGGFFCVNDLGPRAEKVRSSALCRMFGKYVKDPAREDEAGRAFVADCAIPRSNVLDVLSYVRQKYNDTHLIPWTPRSHSLTMLA